MLKIHGRANSLNVRKVLWLADEMGLAFERQDWGRGYRSLDEPEYRRLNPFGVVPTVDDDGFVLRESNTILRYLAASRGRDDLYPAEHRARAGVEAWMDWASTELLTGCRVVFLGKVVGVEPYTSSEQTAAHLAMWTRHMQLLDDHLAGAGPYLTGASFTLADIPVGLIVHRWHAIDIARPALAGVAAYYDLLSQRPAFLAHGRNGLP